MDDAQVFGFVPGNYSIHGSVVSGGNPVECLTPFDLMNDFSGRIGIGLRGLPRGFSYYELFANDQATGGKLIPGLQLSDRRIER